MRTMIVQLTLFCALSSILSVNGSDAAVDQRENAKGDSVISATLLSILEITGVKHMGTLDSIVECTQKAWLRPAGVERWQMEEVFEALHDRLLPYFIEMRLINGVKPSKRDYDYAILYGSTVQRMRDRLAYLLQLYNEGYRFKRLVLFTGQRPLDAKIESPEIIFDRNNKVLPIRDDYMMPVDCPKTESDAIRFLLDATILPVEFKDTVTVEFVESPMQKTGDGKPRRPTTADTIMQWLSKNPNPGSMLSISNQPFVEYQHTVSKTLLPETFVVETVGGPAERPVKVGLFLDTLARWLYQENMYRQKMTQAQ